MGEVSVILKGVAPEAMNEATRAAQRAAMFSTVHGAGRVMGRKQATGVFDRKT